jgi:hypothetical protein
MLVADCLGFWSQVELRTVATVAVEIPYGPSSVRKTDPERE